MTPDERTLLGRFLQDLERSGGGMKDAEAQSLIDQTLRRNPDAAYLLVQHAILADQALHAAQAQIAELQGRLASASGQSQGSFLGGRAGGWGQGAPGHAQVYGNAGSAGQGPWGQAAPPPQQAQPQRGGLFGGGPAQPGGFGSFLRNAGTTAAGVAGGAFLFDSLSGLFGGHGGFGGGGFGGPPVENVTINEYGDQGGGYDDGQGVDDGGYDDGGYDDGGVS